jgi:hypothetical protein
MRACATIRIWMIDGWKNPMEEDEDLLMLSGCFIIRIRMLALNGWCDAFGDFQVHSIACIGFADRYVPVRFLQFQLCSCVDKLWLSILDEASTKLRPCDLMVRINRSMAPTYIALFGA